MSMSSVFVVTNALRLRLFKSQFGMRPASAVAEEPDECPKEKPKPTTIIKVGGMMCNHCKMTVENACKGVGGVDDAVVDLNAKTVTVTGDASKEAIIKAIMEEDFEILD